MIHTPVVTESVRTLALRVDALMRESYASRRLANSRASSLETSTADLVSCCAAPGEASRICVSSLVRSADSSSKRARSLASDGKRTGNRS